MSKSKVYKVQTKVDSDVLKLLEYQIEKKNVTMSEYVRNIVSKAVVKDLDVSTTAKIVGFNRSNNDKVTKVSKPVAYRRLNMKLNGR